MQNAGFFLRELAELATFLALVAVISSAVKFVRRNKSGRTVTGGRRED